MNGQITFDVLLSVLGLAPEETVRNLVTSPTIARNLATSRLNVKGPAIAGIETCRNHALDPSLPLSRSLAHDPDPSLVASQGNFHRFIDCRRYSECWNGRSHQVDSKLTF